MTAAVLAAVIVLATLVVINLLLTGAMVRRIRDHEERLAVLPPASRSGLSVGDRVPPIAATTVDGAEVDDRVFSEGSVVIAFFSARCPACRDHLPGFLDVVARDEHDATAMVVSGEAHEGADLVEAVRGRTHVIVEADTGHVNQAFQIRAFPAFVHVREGVIEAVASAPAALPRLAVASS